MTKPTISILTGAGISAESGLQTFRGSDGLWHNQPLTQIASSQGWQNNPEFVLDFYNERRRQLHKVAPNIAHKALVDLEPYFQVHIITQNVDDLHERAGSKHVTHLHGELFKARSTKDSSYIIDWKTDLRLGDCDPKGTQLRPHVVWFGEAVPEIDAAISYCRQADIFIIIGTSLQVYPAAGLIDYLSPDCPIYVIDPDLEISSSTRFTLIPKKGTVGVPELVKNLIH